MVRIINIDTKARTIRVSNGKDDLEWFTTDTGSHVPLKKGQSKAEAIKEHFGDKKDKVSGKAIAVAKKEMLARQAKERKALRDSSSRLGESYYKQRVNELIKQQEIEEQDFYEGHGIKAPKAKQQPAKKETPDASNADYFKSTMQETMKKFPRLYEHEQKHLEEYAVSAFSALRNNPGKEKAIVDEILDSYNQHVKRLGMWVDTPTLAKKAFVEKLAEAYK